MLKLIKRKLIFKKVFKYVPEGNFLKILKYNKYLQGQLDLTFEIFKEYSNKIILEIIPSNTLLQNKNIFINIIGDKSSYYTFFNDEKEAIKRNYFLKDEKVKKIKIVINASEIKSLDGLFESRNYIEQIKFVKFSKRDIIN